jgi:hypothetical protein
MGRCLCDGNPYEEGSEKETAHPTCLKYGSPRVLTTSQN